MPAARTRPAGRFAGLTAVAVALTLLLLAAAPRPAIAFDKAIWGPPTRNGLDQFPLYRSLGARIWQSDLLWSEVAIRRPAHPSDPSDPAYVWPAELDAAIAEASRMHMRVALDLFGSPAWENGRHRLGWVPARAADFVAFVRAAARRYPSVHLWMIWKEPTKAQNFGPLHQYAPGVPLPRSALRFPRLYAAMLDGAYAVLKRADRANKVIGGCTYSTGAIDTLHWIKHMRLPNGRPPRMDYYAHNPFSYQSPRFTRRYSPFDEVQFSDLPRLAAWIDRYLRRGMPIFLSEFEVPTGPDNEFDFYVDEPVAATWVREALREARRWSRINALGWVRVYDLPPTSSGGLLTANGRHKATFAAFQRG